MIYEHISANLKKLVGWVFLHVGMKSETKVKAAA